MDMEIKKPLNETLQSGKGTKEILESPLFEDKRLILFEQKEKKNGLPFSSVSGISTPVPLSSSTISTTPSPVSQTPPTIESSAKIHNTREKDKLQRKEKLKLKSVKSKDQGIPTRVRPLRSSVKQAIISNEGNYEKEIDKIVEKKEKKSRKRKTEETLNDETQENEEQEDLNEEEEERYCYCRGSSVGKMIACDNPECKIEWFHYKCVGLKEDPKGHWFCPDCIKFKDEILEKLKLQKHKRRKKRKAYY
ncbi:unnamed protein product [[Candida] boidinii]|nr:unnamed protein product [[Candida] boidinii]